MHGVLVLLVLCSLGFCYESPKEFTIHTIENWSVTDIPKPPNRNQVGFAIINTAYQLFIQLFNERSCNFPDILPNTNLTLDYRSTSGQGPPVIQEMIDLHEKNVSLVVGLTAFNVAYPGGIIGKVYDIANLSAFSPSSLFSNKRDFPFFSRLAATSVAQIGSIHDYLVYGSENYGIGWTDVAVAAEVDELNLDLAATFIDLAPSSIRTLAYRTFLIEETNFDIDLEEIKNSGARVIIAFVNNNFPAFHARANEFELVGENYVWFVPPAATSVSFYETIPDARGTLVAILDFEAISSPYHECLTEAWQNADPLKFPFTAVTPVPPLTTFLPFDCLLVAAIAIDKLDKQELLDGRFISPQVWSDTIRSVTTEGFSQEIRFDEKGDRQNIQTSINYYDPEANRFVKAIENTPGDGLVFLRDIVWYSNTTEIPDLDIRPPFHYWSCGDKKRREDKTGKSVVIDTPDGSAVDDIDEDYHCDQFIDCQNMSDESADCGTNYIILFIVFGIITGLLMLLSVLFMVFTLIYGSFLGYQQLKSASPVFLMILLISVFLGYSSIFAFFGKPHPVACGFQPWLLGLPSVSMIAALCAKNYRIWRIFNNPLKRTKISDWRLFFMWAIIMIPVLIILVLWTIISTPTAAMIDQDGMDHYVCTTGGFTGTPGGLVFFFILVAYAILVLVFGAVISILIRNVPSLYNESKLLTISIYNLGFLAAVIIPVFLVVEPFDPFIAWILRTCAVLYAFTATMFLQFLPKFVSIFIVDKGKKVERKNVTMSTSASLNY